MVWLFVVPTSHRRGIERQVETKNIRRFEQLRKSMCITSGPLVLCFETKKTRIMLILLLNSERFQSSVHAWTPESKIAAHPP